MQGIFVDLYNLVVAFSAQGDISGRFLDKSHVGLFLGCGLFITLVA
jgi:hypothetical protein